MNRQGYSLIEALMAMTLFAVGVLALSQSYFGVVRSQMMSRQNELALQCARDRIEEIVNSVSYSDINGTFYPSEDFGDVNGGVTQYEIFNRQIAISDSLNANGTSVIKDITVTVNWQTSGGVRTVFLNSAIARYSDITP